jgi:hypothetical protein
MYCYLNNKTKPSNYCYFYALMHRTLISLLVIPILWASSSLFAQDPSLSYSLHPGEIYMLDIDIQQTTHSESINSEEINLYSRMVLEFHVDSVDAYNRTYLSATFSDLLVSMLAPQLNIDINSGSGRDPLLTEMVNYLKLKPFSLTISSAGELKKTGGLDSLFSNLASYPVSDTLERQVIWQTLNEVYGPDSFGSLFNLFTWVYPAISPMTNWTNDMTYYFNTKAVKMTNRYSLAKISEKGVVIQGIGVLNSMKDFIETTNMGKVKSTVAGNQTYDFLMDNDSGWLQKCVSRQQIKIETTIVESNYLPSGLKIPSFTETVFEVKGSKIK